MKGICFKEPLFIATIKGTKTQTRRIKATTKLAVITGGSLRGGLK